MRPNTPARQTGVTAVELMVALVIVGIIAAMALPSFQTMLENARVRGSADALMSGLQLARAEAIRRNARVRFVLVNTQGAWAVQDDVSGADIQSRSAGEGAVTVTVTPNAASRVTYNAVGRVVDANPITQLVLDASAQTEDLQINVTAGGQIRLCKPAVSDVNDPRKC